MKLSIFLSACALLISVATYAGYKYDYKTGNSYSTSHYGDQTHVKGFNSRTGSNWSTTIDRNGNQRGYDSKGNYWNYNADTGYYHNNNGKTCIGKGYARTCN